MLTIFGVYWQSNMFTDRSKADTLSTSNKRALKEQLYNMSKQTSCDEVHVAVAQATEMSGAEMRGKMGALEHQAEQTWTSHQVTLVEMNSVAGDAPR